LMIHGLTAVAIYYRPFGPDGSEFVLCLFSD
jgi:hypothetical protein